MLFKLSKTSHLESTWTKESFWRLSVTILPLFISSCVLGHSNIGLHVGPIWIHVQEVYGLTSYEISSLESNCYDKNADQVPGAKHLHVLFANICGFAAISSLQMHVAVVRQQKWRALNNRPIRLNSRTITRWDF